LIEELSNEMMKMVKECFLTGKYLDMYMNEEDNHDTLTEDELNKIEESN